MNSGSQTAVEPLHAVLELMRRRPGLEGLTEDEKREALGNLGDLSMRLQRLRASGVSFGDVSLNPALADFMESHG